MIFLILECFIVAYSLKDFRLLPVSFTGKVTAQTEAAQLKHVAIYKTGHVTYEQNYIEYCGGEFSLALSERQLSVFLLQYSVRLLFAAKTQTNKSHIITILGRKDLDLYINDNEIIGNY